MNTLNYPIYISAHGQLYANPETKLIGLSLDEAKTLFQEGSLFLRREKHRYDTYIRIEITPDNSVRVLTCNTKTFEDLVADRSLQF